MKKMIYVFLMLLSFQNIQAKPQTFEINQEHSKLGFSVQYMMMTDVEGVFKKFQGYFDVENNTLSNVQILISTRSVDSLDSKRDFHLRNHEFLYASKFPTITFTSKESVTLVEQKVIKVPGTLTLRGITKPVTLEVIFKGKKFDPWAKENLFFEGKTKINRKDFDIVWNKEMDNGGYLVGDEVVIDFKLQAQHLGDKTPFSTHMVPTTKGIVERDQLKKGKIKKLSTATDKPNTSGNEKKD